MALTLKKVPDVLSLTGNEIAFGIHSDNAFSAVGGKFSGYLLVIEPAFFTNMYGSMTIVFSWAEHSLSVSNSVNGVNQYYAAGPANHKTVLEKLAATLNADYFFSRDFYIYVSYDLMARNWRLRFEARIKGADYNLACNIPSGYTIDIIGSDQVLKENFRIGWQVQVYNSVFGADHWDNIGEVQLETPDESGNILIDVSEFLQKDLSGHFSWPQIYTQNLKKIAVIDQYRIKYFEYYGATPAFFGVKYSATSLCLQGEISQLRMASIIQFGYTFYSSLVNSQRFLTFAPKVKLISDKQRELLYFYCSANIQVIKLYVKAFYTDGTSSADTLVKTLANALLKDSIVEVFTGYSATGVGNIAPSKTVLKYQVWITDTNNNVISEYRTYEVDLRYNEFERYFIYRNKLGLYESFRTTGMSYSKLRTEKGFIKVPLSGGYDITERSTKQASMDKSITFTQNSGHIEDISIINYISEFLESSDAYFCDNKFAYPITILPDSYQLYIDKSGIYSFDFDYSFALDADSTEEFLIANNKGSFNNDFNKSLF